MAVETLPQLHKMMHATIPVRRELVRNKLSSPSLDGGRVGALHMARDELEAAPRDPRGGRRLLTEDGRPIHLELDYELGELKKDVLFLEQGEEALHSYLEELHPGLHDEVARASDALGQAELRTFVTDRDGTLNNYSGRYATSVQSTYNAVFLTRFVRTRIQPGRGIVLTAAPLDDIGALDMMTAPPGTVIVAASKGREYFDEHGVRRHYPIEPAKQKALDELNHRLSLLLKEKRNHIFPLIGSGFQHKFGQTTVARQDIRDSVAPEDSERFLGELRELVASVDPDGHTFRIEDTSLDVEILLTVDDDEGPGVQAFDKGDGLKFLDDDMALELEGGPCLIGGDTSADVPMLDVALELGAETLAVFVTEDRELQEAVRERVPGAHFLSSADAFVVLLNALALDEQQ